MLTNIYNSSIHYLLIT